MKTLRFVLCLALCVLLTSVFSIRRPGLEARHEADLKVRPAYSALQSLPDGPGKDVVVRVCSTCHEPIRIASLRLTEDGWTTTVEDMIKRGAKATPEDQKAIVGYLVENFLGEAPRPLNVNTAEAIDLESVAGLLRREAAAVIEYRQKNGPFKTLDDMKKVPGLDFKKIDTQRDRLLAL